MKSAFYLLLLCLSSLAESEPGPLSGFGSQKAMASSEDLKVPGENPLNFCSAPYGDILILERVDLDPNPPKEGKTLTINAIGIVTEVIEKGATATVKVKLSGITILTKEFDICDLVEDNAERQCPVQPGMVVLTKEVNLPSPIPPATFTVEAQVVTKDDKRITCLEATMSF